MLLCVEGGEDELESALEEEDRAVERGVGESGGVSGRSCGADGFREDWLYCGCTLGDIGVKGRAGA